MNQRELRSAGARVFHAGMDKCSVDPSASKLRNNRCPPQAGDIADQGIPAGTGRYPAPTADKVTRSRSCEGSVDVLLGRRGVAPSLRTGALELANISSGADWSHRSAWVQRVDREAAVKRIPANVNSFYNARAKAL